MTLKREWNSKFLAMPTDKYIGGCVVDFFAKILNSHRRLDAEELRGSNASFLGISSNGSIASSSELRYFDVDLDMEDGVEITEEGETVEDAQLLNAGKKATSALENAYDVTANGQDDDAGDFSSSPTNSPFTEIDWH
ncbi:hypothetical protein ACMFMG_005334 [Clarireedia jacksonii]